MILLLAYNIRPWPESQSMSILTHWYKRFQLLSFMEGVLLLFIYFPGIRKTSWPHISGFQKWISTTIFPKKDYRCQFQSNIHSCKKMAPIARKSAKICSMEKDARIIAPWLDHERLPSVPQQAMVFLKGKETII